VERGLDTVDHHEVECPSKERITGESREGEYESEGTKKILLPMTR